MLANSLTPTKPVSIFDLASVPQAGGEAASTLDFAALLPGLEQPALPEGAAMPAAPDAEGMPTIPATSPTDPIIPVAASEHPATQIARIALPGLAASGKILPPVAAALPVADAARLPVADKAAPAGRAPDADPAIAALAEPAVAVASAPVLLIVADSAPATIATAPGAEDQAQPARRTAKRAEPMLSEGRQTTAETAPPASSTKPGKAAAPLAVALHVAPAAERATPETVSAVKSADPALRPAAPHSALHSGQDSGTPGGDERPAARGEARFQLKAAADLPRFQLAAEAMPATTPIAPVLAGDGMLDGAQPLVATRPTLEAPALRELTRIVETLASAREAFGTGTATLALDHAEFGALSLRFDQRGDGLLSVQLSAADADAQQAVANAVAERPIAAPGEAGGSAMQPQTGSQSQGGGSTPARGASVERESQSTGGDAQRDQHGDRPRGETRGEQPGQRGERRSGIYA